MSEKEAIIELKRSTGCGIYKGVADVAIQALEEIQQYRAIGTVEEVKDDKTKMVLKRHGSLSNMVDALEEYHTIGSEDQCREALERMKPKKPVKVHDMEDLAHACFVECHCGAMNHTDIKHKVIYCWKCGNLLDWSE